MGDNIHKPLGQDRRAGKTEAPRSGGIRLAPVLAVIVVCAMVGAAGWISVSGARITTNEAVIVREAPIAGDPAEIAPGDTPGSDAAASGTEATVEEDGAAAVASRHGQSGAEISTTLGDDGQEILKIAPADRPDNRPVLLTPTGRIGQDPRLAHLPDPAITRDTPQGPLPVRGAGNERAFDIYARPWSGARGARVAIIVGGLGLSQTGTQYAIRTLPEDITLAFAANGNSLQRWMQEARRQGHEILLQIPFEPFDYPANDPGPGTLTVAAGAETNLDDLHAAMGRITNYTGITNFMGGRFLADPDALEPVMRDIADRGLMFVDDGTSAQSLTGTFARTLGIPYAAADMVLDGTQERGYILSRLDDLERTARRNGMAVGVASAFDVSVDAIAAWANEAKARGIEIVAVSATADDPERQ
ncbi:divergent polysaccharide deacetylase family protein [Hoeflea olei]|uniref:Divergent polysaccharide deacetylase family protein n=1 Tax=Hoeflea olei TaxID=1480615 RepID=A0A1C1Z061_9HYPH|nr:divergent polysaccharide deacetylase family protein [Hoeflea olei]OCW59050.1 hypothetical protein AWJ14_04925 [Hoeflea olei]